VFRCGRWLAKNEDDGCIVRELAAEGDEIRKPQPGEMYLCISLRKTLDSIGSRSAKF